MRSGRNTLQEQLVVEVAEGGILEDKVTLRLTDHQGQVLDLELARILTLNRDVFWVDLHVLVANRELTLVNFDVLLRRILNYDRLADTFSNRTHQLECFHVFVVFDGDRELVELVLTSRLIPEGCPKFVQT